MTHTLNRTGLSNERRGQEIVILCMVHYKYKENSVEAMSELIRTILKYNPENFIGLPLGLSKENILALLPKGGIATGVFTDQEVAGKLIREIKSKNLGISVVLSGLFADIREICENAGLAEHTTHYSAGIFGKTSLLPDYLTLDITTQCGHGLISCHYIKDVVRRIKRGRLTAREGAELLSKPCVCGIVNRKRTEEILLKMVEAESPSATGK
jgi:hypothetical protein